MVSMGYEPVEHLPYICENISPEERANVEQLIRLELANQFNTTFTTAPTTGVPSTVGSNAQPLQHLRNEPLQQHPSADSSLRNITMHPMDEENLIANGIRSTMLEMSKQQYEEESDDEEDENMNEDVYLARNVDFPLSSPLEESSSSREDSGVNYTTLGHATSRQWNVNMLHESGQGTHILQSNHLKELDNSKKDLMTSVSNKRKIIDDVNELRKKRQLNDLQPADFSKVRWSPEIITASEMNIEETKKNR
ncbi:hypothetical protein CORT_0B05600 [Candida orthopsilosis Co 90-125]|uniref:Uncharacterized protein n=1 Tax=Candida orthopsilosis (strain 90-125) TaxID=1136231 RepID=H8WZS3_CANO9|nr:hypothetical protein CORT_0B05600 [Candida orthopsilosis Co 90-125]CCG22268.1 hypothetical protein CORT_0B05600 [Candida orthopsilosis Co 90-125]